MAVTSDSLIVATIVNIYQHRNRTATEQWTLDCSRILFVFVFRYAVDLRLITAVSVAAIFSWQLSVFESPVGAILVAGAYGFARHVRLGNSFCRARAGCGPSVDRLCLRTFSSSQQ